MPQFLRQLIGIMLLVVYSTSCGCATLTDFSNASSFKKAPRESFVKILVSTPEYSSSGSGVIINHIDNSNTIILTAGHICKNNIVEMKVLDFYEKPFNMIGVINSREDDLCLVIVDGIIDAPAVKVASSYPKVGDHVFNIAAPVGVHAPNMSLMFDGYYQGDFVFEGEKYKLSIFSVPGMGGSSGSPIFNSNFEIIGVVSRGMVKFDEFMLCVNQERVKALVDYSFTDEFKQDMVAAVTIQQLMLLDFLNKFLLGL